MAHPSRFFEGWEAHGQQRVGYRSAKIADMRSDKQASGYAIKQGMMFLQAAGWKEASPDRLATIVGESDDCQPLGGMPKEKK